MRAAVLAAAVTLPLTVGGSAAAYGKSGKYDEPLPAAAAADVTGVLGMSRGVVADERRDVSALRSSLGLPVVPLAPFAPVAPRVPLAPRASVVPRGWGRDFGWPRIAYCDPHTGPYQMQIERLLHMLVFGRQTRSSCVAIRHYQRTHDIRPAIGYAGPVTWHWLRHNHPRHPGRPVRPVRHVRERHARLQHRSTHTSRITRINRVHRVHHSMRIPYLSEPQNRSISHPNAAGHCPTGHFRIACVDQNRQIMWVQRGRRIIYGPVRIRTGYGRYRTRDGMHRVYWKHRRHISTLYGMPMPYSQFFDRGEAFHGIYGSLTSRHRSFGCVNMRISDARRLWAVLRKGDRVYLWGHMPRYSSY